LIKSQASSFLRQLVSFDVDRKGSLSLFTGRERRLNNNLHNTVVNRRRRDGNVR